jgi:hypothetical protein
VALHEIELPVLPRNPPSTMLWIPSTLVFQAMANS